MKGFTTIELLIGAAIIAMIASIAHDAVEESHCTKWEETSTYVCNGTGSQMICRPKKRCVEFDNE